jgi:hypothetical protein
MKSPLTPEEKCLPGDADPAKLDFVQAGKLSVPPQGR